MSAEARALLGRYGLKPSVDINGIDLSEYDLRTREDVDALGARAIADSEKAGYQTRDYYAWQAALSRNLDATLPSLEYSSGGIAKSIEDQARDLAFAQQDSATYFNPQLIDPRIADATLYGQRIADMDVQTARDSLSALLIDAAPSQRNEIMQAIQAIDASPTSSFHSVSWEAPEESNIVYANTSEPQSEDAYTNWRNQGNVDGNSGVGLPYIRPQAYSDPMLSGVVARPGGGLEYSVADDYIYQQSVAAQESGGDFHQGDASNVF